MKQIVIRFYVLSTSRVILQFHYVVFTANYII